MKIKSFLAALALIVSSQPVFADSISINDIIALTDAQVGGDAIIAKIRSTGAHFDFDTLQMITLRKRGVSPAVLAAMVDSKTDAKTVMSADSPDPLIPHPLGVYHLSSDASAPRMRRIEPTSATQTKTGGMFGFVLTGGLTSLSMKIVVPGPKAKVRSEGNGIFYFYTGDGGAAPVNNSMLGNPFSVTSPNDFAMVHFDAKSVRSTLAALNLALWTRIVCLSPMRP